MSRTAHQMIILIFVMAAQIGAFHFGALATQRPRPSVRLSGKSPMERFDEVLDYFEGKVKIQYDFTDH